MQPVTSCLARIPIIETDCQTWTYVGVSCLVSSACQVYHGLPALENLVACAYLLVRTSKVMLAGLSVDLLGILGGFYGKQDLPPGV